jgi:quercetin dioxygenase-like cupin family protein
MGVSPERGAKMPQKKKDKLVSVGTKIKAQRKKKKYSKEWLAREIGQNKDYIKEVEGGETIPPIGTLLQIARALEIDSGSLLRERDLDLKNRVQGFVKRTEDTTYATLTPDAEQKHLKAFKVTIEPKQSHKGVGYQHEGEEFIYLLSGAIEVTVGEKRSSLKAGDSIHFNSAIKHKVKNRGKNSAELLVVIYLP